MKTISKILYIFTQVIRESNGNLSSVRVVMIWGTWLTYDLIRWWQGLIEDELSKPNANISEIKDLIYPIVSLLITVIIGKVAQRLIEPKTKDNDTPTIDN